MFHFNTWCPTFLPRSYNEIYCSHETMATAARSTERISEGDVYSLVILVQHTRCEHAQIVSNSWDCKMWPIDSCSALQELVLIGRFCNTACSFCDVSRRSDSTGRFWRLCQSLVPRPEASSEQALKPEAVFVWSALPVANFNHLQSNLKISKGHWVIETSDQVSAWSACSQHVLCKNGHGIVV